MTLTPDEQERPRRTQQQRRAGTRRLLLDATVRCLVEHGYRGATTLEIERSAGVSRGARIHYFATKADLLASAVDHLYTQISERYDQAFGQAQAPQLPQAQTYHVYQENVARFRTGLRLLWSIYRSPDFTAVLELQMAARTDPELRSQLRAVGDRHRQLALDAAARHFPSLAPQRAAAVIEAINVSLSGLLLQHHVHDAEQAALIDEVVLGMLDLLAAQHLTPDPACAVPSSVQSPSPRISKE